MLTIKRGYKNINLVHKIAKLWIKGSHHNEKEYIFLIVVLNGNISSRVLSNEYYSLDWHQSTKFVCLFVLLLYVPSQQLWSLRDGQFT